MKKILISFAFFGCSIQPPTVKTLNGKELTITADSPNFETVEKASIGDTVDVFIGMRKMKAIRVK